MKYIAFTAALLSASLAHAQIDAGGTLNPQELTLERMLNNIRTGHPDMMSCAIGYIMTKKGDHNDSKEVFQACAKAGNTHAMIWMSHIEENGLTGPVDLAAAAQWSRKAAEKGDRLGYYNYGLALLRGYGIPQDLALGREMIDKAAKGGLPAAQELQAANYDWETAVPDSDVETARNY